MSTSTTNEVGPNNFTTNDYYIDNVSKTENENNSTTFSTQISYPTPHTTFHEEDQVSTPLLTHETHEHTKQDTHYVSVAHGEDGTIETHTKTTKQKLPSPIVVAILDLLIPGVGHAIWKIDGWKKFLVIFFVLVLVQILITLVVFIPFLGQLLNVIGHAALIIAQIILRIVCIVDGVSKANAILEKHEYESHHDRNEMADI